MVQTLVRTPVPSSTPRRRRRQTTKTFAVETLLGRIERRGAEVAKYLQEPGADDGISTPILEDGHVMYLIKWANSKYAHEWHPAACFEDFPAMQAVRARMDAQALAAAL